MRQPARAPDPASGSAREVFIAFLRLGLTAFGGPIAHLGYFREEVVRRRQWLDEARFADLVALCQFLPGPASSQTAVALGLLRAGVLGAVAAWLAFTLPSAILMLALAFGAAAIDGPVAQGLFHGLKLVAVAVVADAVIGMARSLTPDMKRIAIALCAVALVSLLSANGGQLAAIAFGLVAGAILCRSANADAEVLDVFVLPRRVGLVALALFLLLLFGGPLLAAGTGSAAIARFDAFYRSGALVFGGGHVVLPLLQEAIVDPGWISQDRFLAGYGLAQAVPGPLFSFAAYLGAAMPGAPTGVAGAALAILAIFLPGILVLFAALPFWAKLRTLPSSQAAMRGANAAVVGILAAALYDPVWTGAVVSLADALAALAGFVLLRAFRAPPLGVVLLGASFGVATQLLPGAYPG